VLAEVVPNEMLVPVESPSESRRWPLAALTGADWSYIRREGEVHEELYDLRQDPREQRNLSAEAVARPRVESMRKALSRRTNGPLTPDRFNP
jgi:arylsulfatase A-like enzyme